jgi:DNA-binding NarL/FixJ family response regulator
MTRRQRDIVACVERGLSYAEIGRELGISPETVRVHVIRIAAANGITQRPLRWLIANAPKLLAA